MSVHTIRIESTCAHNVIALQSSATWARGPGRTLSFLAEGSSSADTLLTIEDRVVRFVRTDGNDGPMTLIVQVATTEDRLSLLTQTSGGGTLVVSSDADRRVSDHQQSDLPVSARLVLLLDASKEREPDRGGG
jgi:hypothetical protein